VLFGFATAAEEESLIRLTELLDLKNLTLEGMETKVRAGSRTCTRASV
jgi:hypothetical protein